jgi:hypothetical protein
MNCIGTTILVNCHDMGEDYFILQKLVDVKSIEGFPRNGFFVHPETLNYPVYVGDVRGSVASLISKDNVNPDDFPNAVRFGAYTEIKILGWNC